MAIFAGDDLQRGR